MKIKIGFVYPILLLLLPLSSVAQNRLRVGVLNLTSTYRMILIGLQADSKIQSADLDFEALGFQGEGMDHLNPKFLLEMDTPGVTQVRSFELESLQEDEISDPCAGAHLPLALLDIPHAKRDGLRHAVTNSCILAGKSLGFPIGLISTLSSVPYRNSEKAKKLQAYYLLELIHKALPPFNQFENLKEALILDPAQPEQAETFLKKLGEAIIVRYNPRSNWAGVHFPSSPQGDSFLKWRDQRLGSRVENQAYFLKRADELGLVVASVDHDYGILFIEAKETSSVREEWDPPYHPEFIGLASGKESPEKALKRLRSLLYTNPKDSPNSAPPSEPRSQLGPLVPWTLVSFINPEGPIELADFIVPSRFSKKLFQLSQWNTRFDLAGSFIPFSNFLLKPLRHFIEARAYRKKNTKYLKKLESFGAVLAMAETRYDIPTLPARMNLEGIAFSQFESALKPFGLSYRPSDSGSTERVSDAIHDVTALLISEMERRSRSSHPPSWEQVRATQAAYHLYLDQILKGYFGNLSPSEKVNRSPGSLGSSKSPGPLSGGVPPLPEGRGLSRLNEKEPVIVFMMDGLRPDRFKKAALSGWIPHLKALFFDRGTELLSFTSRSLTLPSWGTILTGYEPDYHGIRSNTPTSRLKQKVVDNYEDPRKDLFLSKNSGKNRAYQHLEMDQIGENGKVYLPDYYETDQKITNAMPISHAPLSSFWATLHKVLEHRREYINQSAFTVNYLDETSAKLISQAIKNDKKESLRLVLIWFAAIDTASHYNNLLLPRIYQSIDQGVGKILEAAQAHPVLKNATVYMISDHGHTGGYNAFDRDLMDSVESPFQVSASSKESPDGALLSNTGFNLVRFFAGDYRGYAKYSFTVGAAHPTAPKFDLGVLEEYNLQPFRWTYPSKAGRPNALIDTAGENIAHIYLEKEPGKVPWPHLNYFELTHFPMKDRSQKKADHTLNILQDLLHVELPNLTISDKRLALKILELSDKHPVAQIAMPLKGAEARKFFDQLSGITEATSEKEGSTRDPVLVLARGSTPTSRVSLDLSQNGTLNTEANRSIQLPPLRAGVILTRTGADGQDYFKYLVLRNFNQDAEGHLQAELSTLPSDDPLNYLGTVFSYKMDSAHPPVQWRTDEEWLKLAKVHSTPTAIFSLSRALTLADRYTAPDQTLIPESVKQKRMGEIPDFLVVASRGYAFHSDTPLESDHGGLSYEEVRNSFFVSSIDEGRFQKHLEIPHLILNRDFMPTIMESAGWGLGSNQGIPLPAMQGKSHWSFIKEVN